MRSHDDQVDAQFLFCANYHPGRQAHTARDFMSDRIRDSFSPNLFELHPCIQLQEWKRGGRHAAGGHGGDRKRNYVHEAERRVVLHGNFASQVERGDRIVIQVDRAKNLAKWLSDKTS
jgi:hypothetical protein